MTTASTQMITKTKVQVILKQSLPPHSLCGPRWPVSLSRGKVPGQHERGWRGKEAGSCTFSPEAAVAFVGVEAAAWFRA